jgi:hypothetical protein
MKTDNIMQYNGYNIVSNPLMTKTETIEVVKSKVEKFFDMVVRWNPCNAHLRRPDFETFTKPSDEIIVMENQRTMVCHPEIFKRISAAMEDKR